jgi:hypothetical protein
MGIGVAAGAVRPVPGRDTAVAPRGAAPASSGYPRLMTDTDTGSSLLQRVVAILVLAVAAWIILKVVIGVLVGIATTIVVVLAVGAVVWALTKL